MRCPRHGSPDHRLVAEVETVEVAECDDRLPESRRDAVTQGEALHVAAAV
jgi:hypothetical protein